MLLLVVLLLTLMVGSWLVGVYLAGRFYGRFIGRVLAAARDTGVLTKEQVAEVLDLFETVT